MIQSTSVKLAREYETIYVLRPDATKESVARLSSRVSEVVAREGGTLTLVESWGRRALAFPVGKHRRAYYIYLKYVGGGRIVSELERNFRMFDEVLKYQTVKLRDEVDQTGVTVNPADIEFEMVEAPPDEEPEESLAAQLGLDEAAQARDWTARHEGTGEEHEGGRGRRSDSRAPAPPEVASDAKSEEKSE
ncbi:MAG: 30S ribosomal protein S6 [Polyangiaceae bacterium]|nr:30S ribosomal protein S6 [Polyangiaceae bacterium]